MLGLLAVIIFFMFRNGRRARAQVEEMKAKAVPGAEVMTNFGLFGILKSVDEVSNVAEIETSPGTIVRVHRQTIAKVVSADGNSTEPRSVEEAMEIANREAEEREKAKSTDDALAAPEYGERITPEKKPRGTKKPSE
jgi:preprotein translocase subunit YajC